jgi:hypothetical protein
MPHIYVEVSEAKAFDAYFFMTKLNNGFINSGRFTGLFDEPGVVGTFCASMLIIDKFNLKNYYNYPLILACIFSVSFAALLMSAVYIIIFGSTKIKIITALLVITFFTYLSQLDIVEQYVFLRFDSDTGLFVSNRTSDFFDSKYDSFFKSNNLLFGMGYGSAQEVDPTGASYKYIIYDFGLIYFISYIISHIRLALLWVSDIRILLPAALIFASIIYQRPFIYQPAYVFIFIAPLLNNIKTEKVV